MTGERIDRSTLEQQLPAILREQLQRDGMPPGHLPSWEYITANTRYSAEGLNLNCKELYDQTLLNFLREQGFGVGSSGKWPTEDEATIQSLEYYIRKLKKNRGFRDSTIESVHSTIYKIYEAIEEQEIDAEILDLGTFDTDDERQRNVQWTVAIIEYMDQVLADSTMQNYPYYFLEYYQIVKNERKIDFNPVEEALDEFEWVRSRGETHTITEDQLRDVWNALENLERCPVEGYLLNRWQMWMKNLIVFLVAAGPRADEVERFDVRMQFHFGDDPHVHFEERKNLQADAAPEYVPIMIGADYLLAYRDYILETGGNGSLVPSPQSESGCRRANTLNEWLKRLCKIANVRLPDETLPTMQNFRQLWKTQYLKALHKNRDHIRFVSEESGTDDVKVDEENYVDDVVNRQHVRELGREHFDNLLDLNELPTLMQEELDQTEYIDRQSTFSDF
ncbi:hypothetical protein [Halovenus halobia]|uniref:hypothetical protein n=1 Tax=Halovenus halobia TaxID=3396622 RepID=UPI003F56A42C